MSDDKKGNPAESGDSVDNTNEVKTDAFGTDVDAPVNPNEKVAEEGGDKKFPSIPDDHPTIVALNEQISAIKTDKDGMGSNLSAQRQLIEGLEAKVKALSDGKTEEKNEETNVLFKEDSIKWSKDLSADEKEEMTDTELKQMDEIAEMKVAQNKLFADMSSKTKDNETKEKENKEVDLNTTIQDRAKELATSEDGTVDTELTNQIIESFKALNFNTEGLSVEDIKVKVELSATQVPNYTPPKEQVNKKGNAVKTTKGAGDDPFGVDKIVEDANKGQEGSYSL